MGCISIIVGESGIDMFYGQRELVIDDKSRVVLPSLYRDQFTGGKCFLTLGMDSCIQIYPKEVFEEKAKEIMQLNDFSREAREIKRTYLGNTFEIQIDSHNRILLPKTLSNKVSIDQKVMIVGVYDHLEMWDYSLYLQKEKEAEAAYEQNAQALLWKKE